MAENSTLFSGRVTVETAAAETVVHSIVDHLAPNSVVVVNTLFLEPAAANVTSLEVGFIEPLTGSFLPRWETTSTLGWRPYTSMLQYGPINASLAVRLVGAGAVTAKVVFDGSIVTG